jgi:hypothetical protein
LKVHLSISQMLQRMQSERVSSVESETRSKGAEH